MLWNGWMCLVFRGILKRGSVSEDESAWPSMAFYPSFILPSVKQMGTGSWIAMELSVTRQS